MVSSASSGWFSMRWDDRGLKELAWKSENATQRVLASVLESFQELVTCKVKTCFREVTTQIWSGELFRGLISSESLLLLSIHENSHVLHLSGKPGDDRSDSKNVFSH